MEETIKDFDKAYESFSNKIIDKYKKEEAIDNIVKDDLPTKFYKIMKFGGYLTIDDYIDDISDTLGSSDTFVMLFGEAISWYLEQCGFRFPISWEVVKDTGNYQILQILLKDQVFMKQYHISKRYEEFIIEEARKAGLYVDHYPQIDLIKDWLSYDNQVIVVSNPSEYFSQYCEDKERCKYGDFYIALDADLEPREAIYEFSVQLCKYLRMVFPKFYPIFEEKVNSLFDNLSNSSNPKCRDAMNENFIEQVKNKFSFKRANPIDNADPIYLSIEESIETLYNKKLIELSGVESDRDLISGLNIVQRYFSSLLVDFSWVVVVCSLRNEDPVIFNIDNESKNIRSNFFVEEKFDSRRTYGYLKRKFKTINLGKFQGDVYFTKISPIINKISNNEKFKWGFVKYEGSKNLTKEEAVDLTYEIVSYMRDNLKETTWNIIRDKILNK